MWLPSFVLQMPVCSSCHAATAARQVEKTVYSLAHLCHAHELAQMQERLAAAWPQRSTTRTWSNSATSSGARRAAKETEAFNRSYCTSRPLAHTYATRVNVCEATPGKLLPDSTSALSSKPNSQHHHTAWKTATCSRAKQAFLACSDKAVAQVGTPVEHAGKRKHGNHLLAGNLRRGDFRADCAASQACAERNQVGGQAGPPTRCDGGRPPRGHTGFTPTGHNGIGRPRQGSSTPPGI
jgi:hypothetical protein